MWLGMEAAIVCALQEKRERRSGKADELLLGRRSAIG
jgi:hypothetical protein